MPKAMFYLLKGDYTSIQKEPQQTKSHTKVMLPLAGQEALQRTVKFNCIAAQELRQKPARDERAAGPLGELHRFCLGLCLGTLLDWGLRG